MSIEKLQRVMWRLRKYALEQPETMHNKPTNQMLQRAIMFECGTSYATLKANRKALLVLGWIKPYNHKRLKLTDKDIKEST